jgi:hypothetical protein
MQRQERQSRLGAVWGNLADLPSLCKADIDVAMAIDLDALRRLRDCRVEEGDGLNRLLPIGALDIPDVMRATRSS